MAKTNAENLADLEHHIEEIKKQLEFYKKELNIKQFYRIEKTRLYEIIERCGYYLGQIELYESLKGKGIV